MGVTVAPTIDDLPTPQNRGDLPEKFIADSAAFNAAIKAFGPQNNAAAASAQANAAYAEDCAAAATAAATAALAAAAAAMSATHYADTSSTAFTPTLATPQIIALDNAGDLFANTNRVTGFRLSDPTCNFQGPLSACNMAGKLMTVTPDVVNNAGNHADWIIYISALGAPPPATANDVRAGTSSGSSVTPSALMGSAAFVALTDAATVVWNTATAINAKVTLGGNRLIGAPTNLHDGVTYTLDIKQDGTGSRVPSWDTIWDWGAALAPTLSTGAGKKDKITAQYSSDSGKLEASFRKSA